MHFTFPAISPFLELVQHAQDIPDKIIVRDHYSNRTATAGELLQSVASLREQIQTSQQQNGTSSNGVTSNGISTNGTNGTNGISASQNKFYYLIAAPGLEYLTSMLTIFSLGGVMSAQSIVIKPEDVLRLFRVAKPKALLHASSLNEKVEAVKALCAEQDNGVFSHLPFYSVGLPALEKSESHTYSIEPASDEIASQNGTLFFTSGTSGKQKGVLHSYAALLASAKERIQTWKMTKNDVFLNQKPGNWMGGIFGILPSLISGACLETCAGVFEPKWFWQRIREGGVSVFDVAPTGYDRLAYYFDEHIAVLPADEVEAHIQGMIDVRVAGVSGSLLSPHTQKRWTELRRGKPLLNLYGSTEMTLICSMSWENPDYPDMCSIGPAVPGVEVKLVDGEMRLKAPTLFTRYISDDTTLTEKAFDEEGFFKSGDCATMNGNSYTLHGRANIDVLHFWGFTIFTGEVETALLSLPYIANAVVLPLPDKEHKERTAAILQLKPDHTSKPPSLEALRKDLEDSSSLMLFKIPTVIYWLQAGEEISLTVNGKISKIDARKKFFGDDWQNKDGVEVMDLSGMEYWRMGGQC